MFENDSTTKEIQAQIIGSNVDLSQLEKDSEKKSFPYLMFMLAGLKDMLDGISFGFLTIFTTPIFFMTFLLWFWGRGFLLRKILWKRVIKKVLATAAIKVSPLAFAPVTMFLVIIVHNQENKIVKVIEGILTGEYEQMSQVLGGIKQIAYGNR